MEAAQASYVLTDPNSPGGTRMKAMRIHSEKIYAFAVGAAILSGCVFSGDPVPTTKTDKPIVVTACADLAPAQKKTADSLVELATAKMTADMEYMFSDTVNDWASAKARNPNAALQLYDQALKVAPGHCGATFGRAVASSMMVTQDPKLDAFVSKAEDANNADNAGNGNAIPKVGSARGLFKLAPDQAAPVLLKLSSDLSSVDYPTVTEFQALVESTLMPKVDSTIAALEQALAYDNFAFEFTTKDDRTIQLDQGEIGPMLAGLKVVKAWLTIAVGYQWELAVNGKYDWMDTINDIRTENFDHLRPGQTAALDQATGLFKTNSLFSKIKPAWKAKVNGIPTLLLSAIDNAQKGLRYSIAEAGKSTGQENDLYVVGTGPEADVDPADLQQAVDLLEHGRMYLTGEVAVTYNKGIRTLKVNFAKIFEIDGIQGKLPYFKFRPYTEWNDTVSADTSWSSEMYGDARNELLGKLGYDPDKDYMIYLRSSGNNSNNDSLEIVVPSWGGLKDTMINGIHTYTNAGDTILATAVRNPDAPCTYSYNKSFNRELIPGGSVKDPFNPISYSSPFRSVPTTASGTITLSLCRETPTGVEYVQYMDVKTKGPIYFTNPAGTLTVDVADLDKYSDDIPALETKIIFPDPTFSGVFPELTQANIWNVINSLKTVEPRAKQICDEVITPDGYYTNNCRMVKVSDPSDLDLLISTSYLMNGGI